MEQLVAPFSNTYQYIYFTTQTKLLRMEAAEQLSCQFTADVHDQISEGNENNNVISKSAPLIGFGPHE
jgi:subtilase family serine protease